MKEVASLFDDIRQIQVRLEKLPIPVKKPRIGDNYADPGDTGVGRYSALESGVQTAETVDSTISNVGAAAGAGVRALPFVTKFAPAAVKAAPALNVARVVGTKLSPVQAVLWGIDAARATLDPEYRAKTLDATHALMDDPSKSTTLKGVNVALNTLARPVTTTGSLIRSYGDSSDRIEKAGAEIARSDRRLNVLQSARRERDWQRGEDDFRRYLEQVSRERRIRAKFSEPVAPREEYQKPTAQAIPRPPREIRRFPMFAH
jgi:hypothetical protein